MSSTCQSRFCSEAMVCRATAALRCPPPPSWKTTWIFFIRPILPYVCVFLLEHAPCHVDMRLNLLCSMSSMGTFIYISHLLHRLFISATDNLLMRCDLHVHSIASDRKSTR